MEGLTVFSVYFYHTEEWTERNQQLLEATSREIRRCPGLWILACDFNMEPETFGQYATPARLPGVLVKPAAPTFRHGASGRCFDYFCGSPCGGLPDTGSARAGGIWHQPSSPGPDKAETVVPRTGHEGAGDSERPGIAHRWLRARASLWMNDERSSCRALSKKSWEDVTSWETRHEPARAEEAHLDGSSGKSDCESCG